LRETNIKQKQQQQSVHEDTMQKLDVRR